MVWVNPGQRGLDLGQCWQCPIHRQVPSDVQVCWLLQPKLQSVERGMEETHVVFQPNSAIFLSLSERSLVERLHAQGCISFLNMFVIAAS